MKNDTSWGNAADWYDELLSKEDTYQNKVILPNLLRIVAPAPGAKILDLACGQGFFAEAFVSLGAEVLGSDISSELIAIAKQKVSKAKFFVSSAHKLDFTPDGSLDSVACVLALQNISNISEVFREVRKKLKPSGRFILILNHPAFRIPGASSWEFSEGKQYRRIEKYLSESKSEIDMHPGKKGKKETTVTFHRPLQVWFKTLANAGFSVTRLEEWISHRESGKGPRKEAEDFARREFPLFVCLEATPFLVS